MKWYLIVVVMFILGIGTARSPDIWVEVHDVSPGYSLEQMKWLSQLNLSRLIFFVIPARGEREKISDYGKFSTLLRRSKVEIGIHGYSHEGFEFFCSNAQAEEKLKKAEMEFRKAGIKPEAFFPPRYLISTQALKVCRKKYPVFLYSGVIDGQFYPYPYHDFSFQPFISAELLARACLMINTKEVLRVGVHMSDFSRAKKMLTSLQIQKPELNCSLVEELAQEQAPPKEVRGMKRKAYSLLYFINMYRVTGNREYLKRAEVLGEELLKIKKGNSWREEKGEPESSYHLLEDSLGTLAMAELYSVTGNLEVKKVAEKAGEHLRKKLELLSFFGGGTGLKPNAISFSAYSLGRTGEILNREDFIDVTRRTGYMLVKMQTKNGCFYNGPYFLPGYSWHSISPWYQAMALLGIAQAYRLEKPGERLTLLTAAKSGVKCLYRLNMSTSSQIMALQASAVLGSCGISPTEPISLLNTSLEGWDANYAFALSLLALECSNENFIPLR